MGFSLGDFAGGAAKGIQIGQQVRTSMDENARQEADAAYLKEQRDRQEKLQKLEDGAQVVRGAAFQQSLTGEAPAPVGQPAGLGLSPIQPAGDQESGATTSPVAGPGLTPEYPAASPKAGAGIDPKGDVVTQQPGQPALTNGVATDASGKSVDPATPNINGREVGIATLDRPKTPLERITAVAAPMDPTDPSRIPKAETREEAMLQGIRAGMDYYAKNGMTEQWVKQNAIAEHIRETVRQQKFDKADVEYRRTGDPIVFAQKVYPFLADGQNYVDGGTTTSPVDGKKYVTVKTFNTLTNKNEEHTYSADQFMDQVKFAMNPAVARAAEAAHAAEVFKSNLKIREKDAEVAATNKGAMSLAEFNKGADSKEKALEREKDLKVAGISAGATLGSARIRADTDIKVENLRQDGGLGLDGVTDKGLATSLRSTDAKRKGLEKQLSDLTRQQEVETKNMNPDDAKEANQRFNSERGPLKDKLRALDAEFDDLSKQARSPKGQRGNSSGGPGLSDAAPKKLPTVADGLKEPVGTTVIIGGKKYKVGDNRATR